MRIRTQWFAAVAVVALCAIIGSPVAAVDVRDTRMLTAPAVSATHIAFIYAGDLWSARLDGSNVRRLTTHRGIETRPRFSPDGSSIAFSGQYDGNLDVFVVPVEGGVPRRLTWHPGGDVVQDWTPDGSAVSFTSGRSVHTNRYTQLFTISLDGGMPEKLPLPYASKASFSSDGSKIAYQPLRDAFLQWKNYRGGTVARIWLYDRGDHSVVKVPQPEGRSNDTDPMWIGDEVYFRSDRNGEFNLFSYDPASEQVRQLTFYEDYPILEASAGGGRIIYEQAGYLHLYDPDSGARAGDKVTVGVAADLIERRPRWIDGAQYLRGADISPSGARAVFEYRGEIITIPAEKGDHRNLTNSEGAHDRSPVWSPDGRWIAYFSDQTGEYELYLIDQYGKDTPRRIAVEGAGFYQEPRWSPDSKWIAYQDNALRLYLLNVEGRGITKVSEDPYYGPAPLNIIHISWSPDSKWIAYTQRTAADFRRIWIYSVEDGSSHPVTDGLSDTFGPAFDAGGKYLYFLASTDAGPVRQWFAMSNADMDASSNIYMAVLPKGVESPLKKESDEEEVKEASAEDEGPGPGGDEPQGEGGDEAEDEAVAINFDHLDQRIVDLPVESANYSDLQAGAEGHIYYIHREGGQGPFGGPGSLRRFDLAAREEETLAEGVLGYQLSADDKKVLLAMAGNRWLIAGTQGKIDPGSGQLSTGSLEVKIDPVAEWRQIFQEAWRINRDYFYDPNFHGADWEQMGEKYSVFLDDLATRDDLNRVLQWMSSELSVGHHRVGGGDSLVEAENIPGGLLGADFEAASGRYRFAKVYGGLNWNPELRSPLTEAGVDVVAGEYLLAVSGRQIRPPENLYSRFENTAGKIVEITVGPNADGSDSRTVEVVPVSREYALRNRDWVEGNIAKVDAATGGRVAYVYVPNTSTLGHTYFKRYFFPQAYKDAIIVDERFNGGGSVADYYIDILRRPYISHWATRYGNDFQAPFHAIQGPKVMIIDETAGSGGDLLPWMFRNLELGPLVGKRTWGGLVGTLGFPVLMDGGGITAPNLAIWTEEGFVVENVGVPPDIEVEQWPAEVIAGHDPQLEKAIEVAMEMLEANPPHQYVKPPFPIRVRR